MKNFLLRFARDTKAATAIEYGLIAAGVSVAIAFAVFAFGDTIYNVLYEELPNALNN